MKIYNTLTRSKQEFIPLKEKEAKIYACGPTVYNFIHIGNARPAVVFDTLRRYLEYKGNKVTYVSNITDIDDKIIKRAIEEGITFEEVARKYENEYYHDLQGLNVRFADVRPRVSDHIPEIIDIVERLIEKAKQGDGEYFNGAWHTLITLTDFIDSLEEEPVSEDMWEASKQYALRQVFAFSTATPGQCKSFG